MQYLKEHMENCDFSSDEIDTVLRSLESVNWNLGEYFRSHSYNLISNRVHRYYVMEYLLEEAPIRNIFHTSGVLAQWSAFRTPDGSNIWKENNSDEEDYGYLDDNSICRLFFCSDEEDVWDYFVSGKGDLYEMVAYYDNKGDDTVLDFLMYFVNRTKRMTFFDQSQSKAKERYDIVIEFLKDYYGMCDDSFFCQNNISKAKEVWETGIEELRVEFIKSEEGLAILKQIL